MMRYTSKKPAPSIARGLILSESFDGAGTACFTGHRHLAPEEEARAAALLDDALRRAWKKGYRRFWCGCALGFDLLAGEAVLRLRAAHPEARLLLAVPCADQAERWQDTASAQRRERLLYAADEKVILSPKYYEGCMQVRNRYMVDRSALVIAWMQYPRGGTLSTVAYAVRQDVEVWNLAMPLKDT